MSKQIANIEQIQSNITVGMDDLVNVFIAKYETSLINQRNTFQDQLKDLNKIISGLSETAIKDTKSAVQEFNIPDFKNGVISIITTIGDNFKLDWERKHVSFRITTKIKTTVKVDYYTENDTSITTAISLAPDIISSYERTMDEKRLVMENLSNINNELRDISRKERQVRGQIAERKFVASGLEDLLNDQELIKLIQM